MADFFYREAEVKLPTGGRIRNNAYVTVKGKGVSLPAATSDMTSTYDPNGNGRPAPVLKSVKIDLKGDAGCLRYAEVSFTCFDVTSFDNLEKALLIPGSEVTIKYGYVGPDTSQSESGEHEFRVYDYSFKITKENYFDCTFKAVGKGGTFEALEINSPGTFPDNLFVSNYAGTNERFPVTNLFEHLQYMVQLKAMGSANSTSFDPKHGKSGILNYGSATQHTGYYGVLVAPDEYNPPSAVDGGAFTYDRIQYVSLGAVVNAVNKYLIKPLEIVFKPTNSNVQMQFTNGRMWSPDPIAMLFPHLKGAHENNYHETERGVTDDYISIDSFDSLGSMNMQGDQSSPAKILLGRDMLISIQTSFDRDAKQVKDKVDAADKPTGGMPLAKFFKKIFATIKENTGGAWDLYLDQDEEDTINDKISIINRKCPGDATDPVPLELDTVGGVNGIRELSLSAKVPKDTQAKYFAQDVEVVSATKTVNDKDAEPKPEPAIPVNAQQTKARGSLNHNGYDAQSVTNAKSAVKAMVDAQTAEEVAKTNGSADSADMETMPWPIEFELTCDGIEGFRFGDTISSKHLPARYRKTDGSGKMVFTVVSYSHVIADNDWKTTVKAYGRLR